MNTEWTDAGLLRVHKEREGETVCQENGFLHVPFFVRETYGKGAAGTSSEPGTPGTALLLNLRLSVKGD